MSREIYTYTDLSKLNRCKEFEKIKHYPQITVSADLRKGLVGIKERDHVTGMFSDDTKVMASEFHKLLRAFSKNWSTDHGKFHELILLSEYLRKRMEKANGDKKETNWLIGCNRNLDVLLASIILFEQAKIRPEDVKDNGDRNLSLFLDAWKYLEKRDPVIKEFRDLVAKKYTKETWNPILQTAFETTESFVETDKIIFHGFYYITPLQEIFMRLLEEAGYSLIFLFPYDVRYPFVYEIWAETYSEMNGYPKKSEWHIEQGNETDPYGEIFEGKQNVTIKNHLEIVSYSSVMQFVNRAKHIRKDGYSLYSSNFTEANQILKDYYPEEFGERKILAYPIGQFVSILNDMWDEDERTVVLEEKNLIECFSSGWLSYEGESSRRYLQDVTYIMPFFVGCKRIEEWEKRILLLKQIHENAIEPFKEELDADDAVSRWQEAINNPLINFSMFAVKKEHLDPILSMMEQLLHMAKELFGNNEVIRISSHIQKLDAILSQSEISNEMYEEERTLVSSIFEALSSENTFDEECAPSDIARALNLFICGRLEEGEIQSNKVGMVYPMYFVDAACIKNNSKVHVCMCDVNAMPGGNKEYVWPLTSDIVKDCYERTKNTLILNMRQIMESTALCNRYFMYCALKNKDVVISWINTVGEKILAPSSYIKLVCKATGMEPSFIDRHNITYRRVKETEYGPGRTLPYDNDKMPSNIIKEAQMAYALCPMKYTLGYILEKYPTYRSEFQQKYALNALISSLSELMKDKKMTTQEIYKNVMALFPGLRKVEKRQVYDYISYDRKENDMDYSSRWECGGEYYTNERLKIHYPNQLVRDVAIGRYGMLLTPNGRKGMDLDVVMEATNDEEMRGKKDVVKTACMFCPHVDYCKNAIFQNDQENYYD